MLLCFFLSGKEISNKTSINVEKVSEWCLAIIIRPSTTRNQTLGCFWPCHIYFSRAYAKLYTIIPALVDLLYLTGTVPVSTANYCTPWKCWVCHAHTIQQFHLLPAHQLLSTSSSSAQGRWVAQSPGRKGTWNKPWLDESHWRAVRGLFAIHSPSWLRI